MTIISKGTVVIHWNLRTLKKDLIVVASRLPDYTEILKIARDCHEDWKDFQRFFGFERILQILLRF